MKIINIDNKKQWEKEISSFKEFSFLQSWTWGEFETQLGNNPIRLKVSVNEKDVALIQYYIVKSKLFSFLYCPRGPLSDSQKALNLLLQELKKIAFKEKVDYILIEPDKNLDSFLLQSFEKIGFKKHASSTQPMHTLILSLTPDIEALYSSVRKTTRALIKSATTNNIKISSFNTPSRFDDFAKLLLETSQRQKIISHTTNYLKRQFSLFAEDKNARLYLAENENGVLAGAIILLYGKTAVYFHAASSLLGRKLGASQLLVWTAINDAKAAKMESFDFWGVAPNDDPKHPWAGITIFKKGFGGETVMYPGSFVLPINKFKFQLFRFITFLRTIPSFKAIHRSLLEKRRSG